MRKNILTISSLFAFMLLSLVGITQNFTALYKIENHSTLRKSPNLPPIYYRLNVKGSKSIYYNTTGDTSKYDIKNNIDYTNHGYVFYTFLNNKKIFMVDRSVLFNSAVEYNLIDVSNLHFEKKHIMLNGHKANIATGKMNDENITIYFFPHIPTAFGPSIYSGLPGLVIRVETPKATIKLLSFELFKFDNFPMIDPGQLTILDEETFEKKRKKAIFKMIKARNNNKK